MAPIPLSKTNMSSFEQLKSCDKLVKVLASRNQQCQTCKKSEFVDHVHFIIDEGCTLNPVEGIPDLVDITCAQCGQQAVQTFKVCGKCKSAFYCNKSCQKSNWSFHAKECGSSKGSTGIENKTPNTQSVNGNVCNGGISQSSVHVPTPLAAPAKTTNAQKPKEDLRSQGDLVSIGAGDEVDKIIQITKEVSKPQPPVSKSLNQNIENLKLETDASFPFILTYGSNPENFYIQRVVDVEKAAFITECLNTECPKIKSWDGAASLKAGQFCACLYESDGNWYRAKLLQKDGEKFHIIFVDYGNPDTVCAENLRPLPPQTVDSPAFALHCKLFDLQPKGDEWSDDSVKEFAKLVESGRFTVCEVHGSNRDGVYTVELLDSGSKSVNNIMVTAGFANKISAIIPTTSVDTPKTSTPKPVEIIRQPQLKPTLPTPEPEKKVESTPPQSAAAPAGLVKKTSVVSLRNLKSLRKPGNKLRCFVDDLEVSNKQINAILTSVFDENKLQFCAMFNVEDFCDIASGLQTMFAKDASPCSDVEVGQLVVVQSEDEEYHRAYVLKVNEDKTYSCLTLDIGLVGRYKDVYPLPPKFLEKPSLFTLISPLGECSENVLRNLTLDEPISIFVYIAQKDDAIVGRIKFESPAAECNVVLKSYQTALSEITESLNKKNPLDTLPVAILSGGKQAALVVFQVAEDKNTFFVVSDTEKISVVMEEMPNLQRLGKPIASPEVGTYCIAKSEDEEWYRAVVIASMPGKSKVFFIDFGNEDLVPNESILSISDEYSPDKIPAQGVKCVLAENCRNDKIHKKLSKAIDSGDILNFEVLSKEGDHYIVSV